MGLSSNFVSSGYESERHIYVIELLDAMVL